MNQCDWCEGALPDYAGSGRRRRFCSRSCRQRSYDERVMKNGVSVRTLGDRDGWQCYLCGDAIDRELTSGWAAPCVDHIIPTLRGGQTVLDNLALVHVRCNAMKGAEIIPHPSWG